MRHKSYTTTQRYINMAPQMDKAIEALHILEVLRQRSGGKVGVNHFLAHCVSHILL